MAWELRKGLEYRFCYGRCFIELSKKKKGNKEVESVDASRGQSMAPFRRSKEIRFRMSVVLAREAWKWGVIPAVI